MNTAIIRTPTSTLDPCSTRFCRIPGRCIGGPAAQSYRVYRSIRKRYAPYWAAHADRKLLCLPLWSLCRERHPAQGSIERYAGDAAAFGQQLFLSPEVGRYRVWLTRALMIKIPAARLRQLVLARGKPRLGYASLMQIVRR